MAFHEVQFPSDIAYGSLGGPEYATDIVMTQGGHEQRNVRWAQARARYNVAHGVKTKAQMETLIAFFRARKGRAHGFRFKDWGDYQAFAQGIAIGTGSATKFQLIKTYSSGSVTEARTISKPVAGTVAIYVNNVAQSSGVSVSAATGEVTFSTPPESMAVISADFEFDVPVRFDTDRLSTSFEQYGAHGWTDIPLVELRV